MITKNVLFTRDISITVDFCPSCVVCHILFLYQGTANHSNDSNNGYVKAQAAPTYRVARAASCPA